MTYPDGAMDDARLLEAYERWFSAEYAETGFIQFPDNHPACGGEVRTIWIMPSQPDQSGPVEPSASRIGPIYDPNPRRSD